MRQSLRRGPGKGGATTAEKLNRYRFARDKTQERFRRVRRRSRVKLPKPLLVSRFKPSPILDNLLPHRNRAWVGVLKRQPTTPTAELRLEDFSFLQDPEATLCAIREIAELEGREITAHLHFQDDYCGLTPLGDPGSMLVDSVCWRYGRGG